jgi:hypothetical protein
MTEYCIILQRLLNACYRTYSVTEDLQKNWNEAVVADFKVVSLHLHGGIEKNYENHSQE